MSTLPAIYRNRTAHRAVVQYRHEPCCAPGIRVAYHYGRGVPIRYVWLPCPPIGDSIEHRVGEVARLIAEADNGIPADRVTTAPRYF